MNLRPTYPGMRSPCPTRPQSISTRFLHTAGSEEKGSSLPANPVPRLAGKGGHLTPALRLIYQDDAH